MKNASKNDTNGIALAVGKKVYVANKVMEIGDSLNTQSTTTPIANAQLQVAEIEERVKAQAETQKEAYQYINMLNLATANLKQFINNYMYMESTNSNNLAIIPETYSKPIEDYIRFAKNTSQKLQQSNYPDLSKQWEFSATQAENFLNEASFMIKVLAYKKAAQQTQTQIEMITTDQNIKALMDNYQAGKISSDTLKNLCKTKMNVVNKLLITCMNTLEVLEKEEKRLLELIKNQENNQVASWLTEKIDWIQQNITEASKIVKMGMSIHRKWNDLYNIAIQNPQRSPKVSVGTKTVGTKISVTAAIQKVINKALVSVKVKPLSVIFPAPSAKKATYWDKICSNFSKSINKLTKTIRYLKNSFSNLEAIQKTQPKSSPPHPPH